MVISTKPDLPFGVESDIDEAEKEREAVPNTNRPEQSLLRLLSRSSLKEII